MTRKIHKMTVFTGIDLGKNVLTQRPYSYLSDKYTMDQYFYHITNFEAHLKTSCSGCKDIFFDCISSCHYHMHDYDCDCGYRHADIKF